MSAASKNECRRSPVPSSSHLEPLTAEGRESLIDLRHDVCRVLLRLDSQVPPPRAPSLLVLRKHSDVSWDAAEHLQGRGGGVDLRAGAGPHERPGCFLCEALLGAVLLQRAQGRRGTGFVVASSLKAAPLARRSRTPRRPWAERWRGRTRGLRRELKRSERAS